jgi:two-component system sensor histidine kinase ResE
VIKNSVVLKLWLTIVGLVVVVLGLLSVYLEQFIDSYFYQVQAESLVKRADHLRDILRGETDRQLAFRIANELAYDSDSTFYLLGSPSEDANTTEIMQSLPVADQKLLLQGSDVTRRGNGSVQRIAQLNSETENLWVYVPLMSGSRLTGLLVVEQPLTASQIAISKGRNGVFYAGGLAIIMTTGLAFVVSKNLSRPLIQMNEVAERMARGDFRGKVRVVTGDEVGRLGITLNKLASELEENIEALSREKEQLANILTSMTDGVISADIYGKVVLANPPARKWMRNLLLAEEGRPYLDRLPRDLIAMEEVVMRERRSKSQEMQWQGRTFAVTMAPLYERQGEALRGVVAVLRDITEERRLETMRRDFVANVSHELRTPLSMLQGYSEALLDEFIDDPEQRREIAQIILEETLRMRRLVNDLLDLAQLESGQFVMDIRRIDVEPLVRKVGRKFAGLAVERGIELQVALPDQWEYSPVVMGDFDRLEQVLTNLVDNALRHTPPGGNVTIRLDATESEVRMEVRDTGTGIPAEELPFIFERFYKVDKARTRSKGGTGLGLSITKNIVQMHNGWVDVQSEVGSGTAFIVILPRAAQN